MSETSAVFRVVCAWCKAVLVEGSAGAPVSHGMCPKCEKEVGA